MINFDQLSEIVSQFAGNADQLAPESLNEQLGQFGLDAELAQNLDLGDVASQLMENGIDVENLDVGEMQTLAEDLAAGNSLGEIAEHITSIKGQ